MQKLTQLFVIILASVVGFGCNGVMPQRPVSEKDLEFLMPEAAGRWTEYEQVSWSRDEVQKEASNLHEAIIVKMREKASEVPGKMRDARGRFLYTYAPWALSEAQVVRYESEQILRKILADENLKALRETIDVYGNTSLITPIRTQAGRLAMDAYCNAINALLENSEDPARTLALMQEHEDAVTLMHIAYESPRSATDDDRATALKLP